MDHPRDNCGTIKDAYFNCMDGPQWETCDGKEYLECIKVLLARDDRTEEPTEENFTFNLPSATHTYSHEPSHEPLPSSNDQDESSEYPLLDTYEFQDECSSVRDAYWNSKDDEAIGKKYLECLEAKENRISIATEPSYAHTPSHKLPPSSNDQLESRAHRSRETSKKSTDDFDSWRRKSAESVERRRIEREAAFQARMKEFNYQDSTIEQQKLQTAILTIILPVFLLFVLCCTYILYICVRRAYKVLKSTRLRTYAKRIRNWLSFALPARLAHSTLPIRNLWIDIRYMHIWTRLYWLWRSAKRNTVRLHIMFVLCAPLLRVAYATYNKQQVPWNAIGGFHVPYYMQQPRSEIGSNHWGRTTLHSTDSSIGPLPLSGSIGKMCDTWLQSDYNLEGIGGNDWARRTSLQEDDLPQL